MARPRRRRSARRAGARRALSVRRAAALGVVQGAAELAPISSSAHVALLAEELDARRRRTLEVAVHGGTALVLPWVVRDVRARLPRGILFHVAAATPPVLVGAVAAEAIERRAADHRAIAAGLLAGAAALAWTDMSSFRRHAPSSRQARDATAVDGLALGLAQAAALLPGVSRRGATLSVARARGFTREAAGDLSWVAGVPVMAAAAARGVVMSAHRGELGADLPPLATGAATAALTLVALSPARGAIERTPYAAWAAWRVAVAVAALGRGAGQTGTLRR
ncbi:undecaprenyl-diphosphate phosphatase [Svornostia abyssi]|uniref:Undecaprenyl-diphosphatase n=1 Tax=Svornostia abyssi TaxID=2898438 RepID=A0ABY5PJC3_9ACTN|nr:undecaprenyl-diphosphate phosphatase [Parviterribacteraceae bacterium J379]